MFFANGIVGPAARPIEFRDERRIVVDADLIHAVLVAVQSEEAAIAGEAQRLHGIQDVLRRERGKRQRAVIGRVGCVRHGRQASREFRADASRQ